MSEGWRDQRFVVHSPHVWYYRSIVVALWLFHGPRKYSHGAVGRQ